LNCKGDEDVDAKRFETVDRKTRDVPARKELVLLVGTDQWITSGPAARTAALAFSSIYRMLSLAVRLSLLSFYL
jgi:hypothetical protein